MKPCNPSGVTIRVRIEASVEGAPPRLVREVEVRDRDKLRRLLDALDHEASQHDVAAEIVNALAARS